MSTLFTVALVAACSQGAPASAPIAPAVPVSTSHELSASQLAGHWQWSFVSERDGVRRVELESWELLPGADDSRALSGTCTRTVTFLSQDGMPFSCNQSLDYDVSARYRIEGVVRGAEFELRETDYEIEPSPCESGERSLASYKGSLISDGHELRLSWDTGEQTLTRVPSDELPDELPDKLPDDERDKTRRTASPSTATSSNTTSHVAPRLLNAPADLVGAWRWHSRTSERGEVRVEVEDWYLEPNPAGGLRGTLERTVTLFHETGKRYPCNGDTFYRYRDTYALRGERRGNAVTITEVEVQAENHPCLQYQERHLDAATGILVGDYLALTWRGHIRQVLHRPPTDADAAN